MLQIAYLFKDLYEERWGKPDDPLPAQDLHDDHHSQDDAASYPPRPPRRKPSAWSFILPIDRRLR